jgi:hypothetical protein
MKTKAALEVPKFRYLSDVKTFLDKLATELDESGKLVVQQQRMLASLFKVDSSCIRASMVFNITPTDRKDQQRLVRRMKKTLDPELTKVVVPNMKKLQSQYSMAEDLYEKHKAVEQVETTLSLSFPNRQGPEYNATMAQINSLKKKIADQLKICFQFLNEVAEHHVPKQFRQYIDLIAELVNEHVIFRESSSFLYVSVDDDGNLVFTSYLMLQDVANDEGDVAPHLYVSIQWRLSEEPTVHVDMNHEFETPNKLIGSGEEVDSVGSAVKAISEMLEMENFSSALGVVPLALQLKVDPSSLNPSLFSYRDFISKVEVDENSMIFVLRKEADSPETVTEIGAQLYKELKALMKTSGVRLTMRQGCNALKFNIVKVAEGGEFNTYDMEFMRDKFGLTNQALRKIVNIINSESSREKEERKLTPVSNDLAELTRKSQEQMKEQMKNRKPAAQQTWDE